MSPEQPPAKWPGWLFAVLVMCGLAGYGGCLARHFCMCGHMAHPPYAWWDYALDVGWVFNFSAAGVVAVVRWGWGGVLWAGLLAALVVSRLVFPHTMGLSLICVELPVSVALLTRSIRLLLIRPALSTDAVVADR